MRTIRVKCPKGYNLHSPVVLTRGIQNVGIDPEGVEQNNIIVPPRWGSACNYCYPGFATRGYSCLKPSGLRVNLLNAALISFDTFFIKKKGNGEK